MVKTEKFGDPGRNHKGWIETWSKLIRIALDNNTRKVNEQKEKILEKSIKTKAV